MGSGEWGVGGERWGVGFFLGRRLLPHFAFTPHSQLPAPRLRGLRPGSQLPTPHLLDFTRRLRRTRLPPAAILSATARVKRGRVADASVTTGSRLKNGRS